MGTQAAGANLIDTIYNFGTGNDIGGAASAVKTVGSAMDNQYISGAGNAINLGNQISQGDYAGAGISAAGLAGVNPYVTGVANVIKLLLEGKTEEAAMAATSMGMAGIGSAIAGPVGGAVGGLVMPAAMSYFNGQQTTSDRNHLTDTMNPVIANAVVNNSAIKTMTDVMPYFKAMSFKPEWIQSVTPMIQDAIAKGQGGMAIATLAKEFAGQKAGANTVDVFNGSATIPGQVIGTQPDTSEPIYGDGKQYTNALDYYKDLGVYTPQLVNPQWVGNDVLRRSNPESQTPYIQTTPTSQPTQGAPMASPTVTPIFIPGKGWVDPQTGAPSQPPGSGYVGPMSPSGGVTMDPATGLPMSVPTGGTQGTQGAQPPAPTGGTASNVVQAGPLTAVQMSRYTPEQEVLLRNLTTQLNTSLAKGNKPTAEESALLNQLTNYQGNALDFLNKNLSYDQNSDSALTALRGILGSGAPAAYDPRTDAVRQAMEGTIDKNRLDPYDMSTDKVYQSLKDWKPNIYKTLGGDVNSVYNDTKGAYDQMYGLLHDTQLPAWQRDIAPEVRAAYGGNEFWGSTRAKAEADSLQKMMEGWSTNATNYALNNDVARKLALSGLIGQDAAGMLNQNNTINSHLTGMAKDSQNNIASYNTAGMNNLSQYLGYQGINSQKAITDYNQMTGQTIGNYLGNVGTSMAQARAQAVSGLPQQGIAAGQTAAGLSRQFANIDPTLFNQANSILGMQPFDTVGGIQQQQPDWMATLLGSVLSGAGTDFLNGASGGQGGGIGAAGGRLVRDAVTGLYKWVTSPSSEGGTSTPASGAYTGTTDTGAGYSTTSDVQSNSGGFTYSTPQINFSLPDNNYSSSNNTFSVDDKQYQSIFGDMTKGIFS